MSSFKNILVFLLNLLYTSSEEEEATELDAAAELDMLCKVVAVNHYYLWISFKKVIG